MDRQPFRSATNEEVEDFNPQVPSRHDGDASSSEEDDGESLNPLLVHLIPRVTTVPDLWGRLSERLSERSKHLERASQRLEL